MSTLQGIENGMAEITVEVEREAFQKAVELSYRKNIRRLNVPGFRRGKAPRKVAETMYGPAVFYEDAVDAAVPDLYAAAVEEHSLDLVGRPEIDVTRIDENGFTFSVKQHVRPEAVLKQYKGLSAPKNVLPVTDADVDDELERLRERNARVREIDGPLCDGDIAFIDFEGFIDGVAFPGGKSSNHRLVIGSGSFIPGFEEQLIGASAGGGLDVTVTFPQDYHAPDLAGKEAVFKVTVNETKRSEKPALDDEFAQDASEFDTLAEFKADIRQRFEKLREKQADEEYENALVEKLLECVECDVPEVMVDDQLENIMYDFRYRLSMQGLDLPRYLRYTGQSASEFQDSHRENAKKQVLCQLAFLAISKAEGLSVSDDEVEAEYKKLAEMYKMNLDDVRSSVSEKTLRRDMLAMKGSDFLTESAAPPETGGEEKPKKAKKPAKPSLHPG